MNAIFLILFVFSLLYCIVFSPEKVLPAMLDGANKSLVLLFTLASIYCVWMGVYCVLQKSKLTDFLAKLFKRPIKRIFKAKDKELCKNLCLNLVSNALGLGGIATPLGITACKQLEDENNIFGAKLLLVISASSVQLLPTSVISLISASGGKSPESIILPTLICTVFSTTLAVGAFVLKEKITSRFFTNRQVNKKSRGKTTK